MFLWERMEMLVVLLTIYQGAGACAFVTSLSGWWILFAIMLAVLDFPFQIPVGDLSRLIRGGSERTKNAA
jgi:hypothetical protein